MTRRSAAGAVLLGLGLMAAVDEVVFHQVLHWHHFYDRASAAAALLSDGLLHSAQLVALVAGGFLLADERRRGGLVTRYAVGWLLVGAGGFQVLDGVVDHKLLRVHQIRYGVSSLLPYDLAWNLAGVALAGVGVLLLVAARRPAAVTARRAGPAPATARRAGPAARPGGRGGQVPPSE